ncbi:MAG: CBS domain-containing protein [Bdellovibrionales bacterium]|nr:CBS domain-containing protein [Bdellovibrionales bacterium]
MKTMPTIQKFMTAMPHTIGLDISVKKALDMMREFGIRHLPVQDGGKLVGILTDRDLKLAASFQKAEDLTAEDVMSPDPYTVDVDSPLDEVSQEMAAHKYGAAIVTQKNGKIVGIFTAVDGLRVLAEVLEKNYRN